MRSLRFSITSAAFLLCLNLLVPLAPRSAEAGTDIRSPKKAVRARCVGSYGELDPTRPSLFSDEDLVTAALILKNRGSTELLSPAILREFRGLTDVRRNADLLEPRAIENLFSHLRSRIGEDEFDIALGSQIRGVKDTLSWSDKRGLQERHQAKDIHDMLRGLGWVFVWGIVEVEAPERRRRPQDVHACSLRIGA